MEKITLEDFVKNPKDSNVVVTLNTVEIFIFTKDKNFLLQTLVPKNLSKKDK